MQAMNDREVQKQIDQMTNFITQEAKEKAEEIDAKADEEFNIEKGRLVLQHRNRITEFYTKKEKQNELQNKINSSNALNAARIKLLKAKEAHLEQIFADAKAELGRILRDPKRYAPILEGLVTQGVFQMLEANVQVRCRAEDADLLESVLPAVIARAKKEVGLDCVIKVARDKPLTSDKCGGVELVAARGKIRVENTLDNRLDLIATDLMPKIRTALFGLNDNRKFLD